MVNGQSAGTYMLRIATALSIGIVLTLLAGCGGAPVATDPISPLRASPGRATAQLHWRETLLHSFDYKDGAYDTYSGLIFDAAGDLYGTAQFGGGSICDYDESCGVVFELTRGTGNKWTETLVHSFSQCDALGFWPRSGLIADAKGNLYGTTDTGGPHCDGVGPGTVFELSPNDGTWTPQVIYQFLGGSDGDGPQAALTFDAAGNLYGTTSEGGDRDDGTVFELKPQRNGTWLKLRLHSFTNREGWGPQSKLTLDKAGDLYGTTDFGGAYRSGCGGYGCGTAFALKPGPNGSWNLKVLHSFGHPNDGAGPVSGLTVDSAGHLFGVTAQGGMHGSACLNYGCGTVYELLRQKTRWTERIIHEFGSGTDGSLPRGDLVFDQSGALYGTAVLGGLYGAGNAFRLIPGAKGKWQEDVLHNFGRHKDGVNPYSGMIFDKAQNLYGTTASGGKYDVGACLKSHGCGTIFEIATGGLYAPGGVAYYPPLLP